MNAGVLRRCRRGARLATTHGSATWPDALRPVHRHNEGARELPIGWRSSTIAVASRHGQQRGVPLAGRSSQAKGVAAGRWWSAYSLGDAHLRSAAPAIADPWEPMSRGTSPSRSRRRATCPPGHLRNDRGNRQPKPFDAADQVSRSNHFETRSGSVEMMISSKRPSLTALCTDSNGSDPSTSPSTERRAARSSSGRAPSSVQLAALRSLTFGSSYRS